MRITLKSTAENTHYRLVPTITDTLQPYWSLIRMRNLIPTRRMSAPRRSKSRSSLLSCSIAYVTYSQFHMLTVLCLWKFAESYKPRCILHFNYTSVILTHWNKDLFEPNAFDQARHSFDQARYSFTHDYEPARFMSLFGSFSFNLLGINVLLR